MHPAALSSPGHTGRTGKKQHLIRSPSNGPRKHSFARAGRFCIPSPEHEPELPDTPKRNAPDNKLIRIVWKNILRKTPIKGVQLFTKRSRLNLKKVYTCLRKAVHLFMLSHATIREKEDNAPTYGSGKKTYYPTPPRKGKQEAIKKASENLVSECSFCCSSGTRD